MAGKTYSEAWAVSSKALDDCGVYNDLLNNLDIRGKWVVQLGIGIGIETERIAERAPGCLLGLDNDIAMIKHSAEYLNGKHLPVKVIIDEAGLRHYYNYDWKINPALINLALADYSNSLTLDLSLYEKFDAGVFTFFGGRNYMPFCGDAPILDPLEAYDFLLKPGGLLLCTQRMLTNDIVGLQEKDLDIPTGYTLESYKIEPNRAAFEASMKGNNGLGAHCGKYSEIIRFDGARDGELINSYLDEKEAEGLLPVICTMVLAKV